MDGRLDWLAGALLSLTAAWLAQSVWDIIAPATHSWSYHNGHRESAGNLDNVA